MVGDKAQAILVNACAVAGIRDPAVTTFHCDTVSQQGCGTTSGTFQRYVCGMREDPSGSRVPFRRHGAGMVEERLRERHMRCVWKPITPLLQAASCCHRSGTFSGTLPAALFDAALEASDIVPATLP